MAYPIGNFTLYIHTNKINNKKYIGITQQKPEKRWQNGFGYIKCPLFYNAIKKYGWDNFKHEIILQGLDKETACKIEIELIRFYKSNQREYGYNISNGGECNWLGLHHSKETKEKMSIAKKNMSKESRLKNAQSHKGLLAGNKNPMYGKSGALSPVSRKIICLNDSTIFDSIADAGRKLNVHTSHVSSVCKNKLNHVGGYRFMYLEDYEKNIK